MAIRAARHETGHTSCSLKTHEGFGAPSYFFQSVAAQSNVCRESLAMRSFRFVASLLARSYLVAIAIALLFFMSGCLVGDFDESAKNRFGGGATLPGEGGLIPRGPQYGPEVPGNHGPGGTSTGNAAVRFLTSTTLSPFSDSGVQRINLCVSRVMFVGERLNQIAYEQNLTLIQPWISLTEDGDIPLTGTIKLPEGPFVRTFLRVSLSPICKFEAKTEQQRQEEQQQQQQGTGSSPSIGGSQSASEGGTGGGATTGGSEEVATPPVVQFVSAAVINSHGTSLSVMDHHIELSVALSSTTDTDRASLKVNTQRLADAVADVSDMPSLQTALNGALVLDGSVQSNKNTSFVQLSFKTGQNAGALCIKSVELISAAGKLVPLVSLVKDGKPKWFELPANAIVPVVPRTETEIGGAQGFHFTLSGSCVESPGNILQARSTAGVVKGFYGSAEHLVAGEAIALLGEQRYHASVVPLMDSAHWFMNQQYAMYAMSNTYSDVTMHMRNMRVTQSLPLETIGCPGAGLALSMIVPQQFSIVYGNYFMSKAINPAEFFGIYMGCDADGSQLTHLAFSNRTPYLDPGIKTDYTLLDVRDQSLIPQNVHLNGWACSMTSSVAFSKVDIRNLRVGGVPEWTSQNTYYFDDRGVVIPEFLSIDHTIDAGSATNRMMDIQVSRSNAGGGCNSPSGADGLPMRGSFDLTVNNRAPRTSHSYQLPGSTTPGAPATPGGYSGYGGSGYPGYSGYPSSPGSPYPGYGAPTTVTYYTQDTPFTQIHLPNR